MSIFSALSNKKVRAIAFTLGAGGLLLIGTGCCFNLSEAAALFSSLSKVAAQSSQENANSAIAVGQFATGQTAVTASGRLEPAGEIATITVPAFLKDERVTQVYIKQGDWVKSGQVLCKLDADQRLGAEVKQAQLAVCVAQTKLQKVQAGAKLGEINAQKAAVDNLKAELQNKVKAQEALISKHRAEAQFNENEAQRYSSLAKAGAISTSQAESKSSAAAASAALLSEALTEKDRLQSTLRAKIAEANALLAKIAEVRPVDVDVAQAELEEARALLKRKEIDLRLATIRAPKSGRVLKVNIHEGESISDRGIAQIAFTDKMCAIAEIHQSDISKIIKGQRAIISGDAFRGTLHGTVERIGWQVLKQRVYAQEPNASSDNRVVEVKIEIDQGENRQVQNLTNLQVEIAIPLERG